MKLLPPAQLVPCSLALWLALGGMTPGNLYAADPPTVTIEGQPPGSLSGKRVVLDPGHGQYFDPSYGWQFQRDPINGLHEDKHTNEIVMDWLRDHLEAAGARVFSTRAPSRQAANVIVDNGDPGYTETGTWTTTTNVNVGYHGSYRYAGVAHDAATATATWSATLPARGDYPVWLWCYAGADRSQQASFTIHHAGGTTRVRLNQQLDRQRWVYVGTYSFIPTQPAAVTLDNFDPNAKVGAGVVVIADAVRFGVGLGDFLHNGKPSGSGRWAEESFYYMLDHGAPESVYKTQMAERDSGLYSRPLYADWQGADAFVSIHTNSADKPNVGSGVSSYIHSTMPTAGSDKLQTAIHTELVRTTRTLYVSDFKDRGKLSADFAVVREIKTMPAVLLELAFHDTETPDATLLRDPNYRRDISRAIYKGVLHQLNAGAPVAPLPPTLTAVTNLGASKLGIRWQPAVDPLEPTATAQWYRLFVMHGDTGFGSPVEIHAGTEYVMADLPPGEKVSFQVRAVNAGGQSLPSAALSAIVDAPTMEPPLPPPPDLLAATEPPAPENGCTALGMRPRTPTAGIVLLPLLIALALRRRRRAA